MVPTGTPRWLAEYDMLLMFSQLTDGAGAGQGSHSLIAILVISPSNTSECWPVIRDGGGLLMWWLGSVWRPNGLQNESVCGELQLPKFVDSVPSDDMPVE